MDAGGHYTSIAIPDELVEVSDELAGLPVGELEAGGIPWRTGSPERPNGVLLVPPGAAARRVPVGEKGTEACFLHACRPGNGVAEWRRSVRHSVQTGAPRPDYLTVFSYVVRYADGTELRVPVRWAEGVEGLSRRTFEPVSRFIGDLPCARIAWKGQLDQAEDRRRILYVMEWPNPYPEKEIASIDVVGGDAGGDAGVGILLGMAIGHAPPPGKAFYVAPSGEDANPGTFEEPWASLRKAAETLQAGDTVYVRGGSYRVREVISPHNSGREGAWITYAGFPGETAVLLCDEMHCPGPKNEMVIDNGEKVTVVASRSGAFHVCSRSYIRVRNLEFRDAAYEGIAVDGFPWWTRGLPEGVEPSHHIEILYNTVARSVTTGIGAWGSPGAEVRDIRIVGNRVLNAFDPQLILSTTDPGFQARERRALREGTPVGEENLDVVCVHGFEVAHNEVSWGGKEGIDCKGNNQDGEVHHNYCHDMFVLQDFPGGKVGIYIDSWRGDLCRIDLYHNVCERNGHGICLMNEGGSPLHDVRIRRNLCRDNYWWGISVRCNVESEEWVRDIEVVNNTVFRNGYHTGNESRLGGIALTSSARRFRNLVVRNNICADNRDYPLAYHREADLHGANVRMEYNLCWPLELRCRPGQLFIPTFGALPVLEAPEFVDPGSYNFRLSADSPAVDAGHPDPQYNDPDGSRNDIGAFAYMQKRH